MQSLSAERPPGSRSANATALTQRLLLFLVTASASVAAMGAGALAAASANVAIVGAAGLLGAACLAFASSAWSLSGLLIIRGLTDSSAANPIVAGLNAGSLVGLVVILSAAGLIAARLAEGRVPVRGLAVTFVLGGLIAYWFGIGVIRYGMDQTLTRELVRTTSILAVGLIAANSDRSITASRMATIVVIAALIPALLVVYEALTNWSEMVGGQYRPRGTMSHPNAAAILFGIAAPMAAWKAIHDRAGAHYLVAAGVFILAVLLTRSMGGLAQLIIAMLALGALQNRGPAYRLGVFVAIVAIVAVFVLDPLGISRVSEIETTDLSRSAAITEAPPNSFEWRLINWDRYLDSWGEARLLGHGLGSTSEIISPLGHLPHSDPIRFIVETGMAGVALIAVTALLMLIRVFRFARNGPNASFAGATLAVLAGVGTHSLVTHVSFNTAPVYVLAALLGWFFVGAASEAERDADPEAARGRPSPATQPVGRPTRAGVPGVRGAPGAPRGSATTPRSRVPAAPVPRGRVADSTSSQPPRRSLSRRNGRGEE